MSTPPLDEAGCSCWPWRKQKTSQSLVLTKEKCTPSTTEYVLEGTKISLELLKGAADLVPVPYVGLAVETASRLLTASEQVHASREHLDELKGRVCALLLVMIAPHRGKEREELPQDLESDLVQLKSELETITQVLEEIAEQHFLWSMLLQRLNAEKIQNCSSQLEVSMGKFEVARQISNAVRLCESLDVVKENLGVTKAVLNITQDGLDLARQNSEFTAQGINIATEGLDTAKDSLHILRENLEVSRMILENQRPPTKASLTPRIMPSKPLIFHGRETVVEDIACRITAEGSPRVAILGPGGMGKTSVALAVMECDEVKAKFGNNCFWVPCVEATTPALLLELLAESLQVTQVTGGRLANILSELQSSPDPRLIILDNFETPWDRTGRGSKVEDYLCALTKVPHIAILLTMRSNKPPSQNIAWDHPDHPPLAALDESAARLVYLDIHPAARSDPQLDVLLQALGHMPLAITLMATVGVNSEAAPTQLLKDWNNPRIRADLLADGSESINISVQLSIKNPHMQDNPDAITLLAILAMLPGGARHQLLPQLAPSIISIPRALVALKKSALVESRSSTQSDPQSIHHVQPVIAAYVLKHHPLTPDVRQDVYKAFYKYVDNHKSEPGDAKFVDDIRALSDEETNIQAILLEAAESKDSAEEALNALVSFCWYHHWTIPRNEVIKRVVCAAKAAKIERCVAEGLYCQGGILRSMDRYTEACRALEEARTIFQTLNEPRRAAECLLQHSETSWWMSDDLQIPVQATKGAEEAHKIFQTLGDPRGCAESMLLLGKCKMTQRSLADARELLKTAQQEFLKQDHPLGAAHCLTYLARTNQREGHHAESLKLCQEAREVYKRSGCALDAARCLIYIGWSQTEQSLYSGALATFQQGLAEYLQLGIPLGCAWCLEGLGDIHQRLSHYDLACAKYKEAQKYYKRIDTSTSREDFERCLKQYNRCLLEQDRVESPSTETPAREGPVTRPRLWM